MGVFHMTFKSQVRGTKIDETVSHAFKYYEKRLMFVCIMMNLTPDSELVLKHLSVLMMTAKNVQNKNRKNFSCQNFVPSQKLSDISVKIYF